eukprot:jgi/Hompol1/663/HPOL_000874-RA
MAPQTPTSPSSSRHVPEIVVPEPSLGHSNSITTSQLQSQSQPPLSLSQRSLSRKDKSDTESHNSLEGAIRLQVFDGERRDSASSHRPISPPDGGFGWAVVVAAFCINMITIGLPASVFRPSEAASKFRQSLRSYSTLPDFNGASSLSIAFIGSLCSAGLPLFAIPSGRLSDLYGARIVCAIGGAIHLLSLVAASFSTSLWQLFITQGFLLGMSCSLSHLAGVSVLSDWFIERRGLAMGIAFAGSGIGGLALGPVLRILLSQMDWRWTLRITGLAGGSLLMLCAFLLHSRTPRKTSKAIGLANFKDTLFLRLYLVAVFYSFGYFSPFFYLPTYAIQQGLTKEQGALLVGVLSGASGVGRVVLGFAADHLGYINTLTTCLILATASLALIWPFATTMLSIALFAVAFGFFVGGFISLTPTVVVQLFGAEGNIATVTGTIFSGYLFGDLFGTPIAGAIIDVFTTHLADGTKSVNYIPMIMYAGACFGLGCVFVVSIKYSAGNKRFFVKI